MASKCALPSAATGAAAHRRCPRGVSPPSTCSEGSGGLKLMKGMRLSVLIDLMARFRFDCKRAARILSFDSDLCSLCPACRLQHLRYI
jgi:hypothetical protein